MQMFGEFRNGILVTFWRVEDDYVSRLTPNPQPLMNQTEQGAREGATLWLVPVSISYERVPEQARLAEELLSSSRNREGAQGRVLEHQEQQQQQQEKQKHVGAVGLTGLLR